MKIRLDKLGIVIAIIAAYGLFFSAFGVLKPNRILQGQAKTILEALPAWAGYGLLAFLSRQWPPHFSGPHPG